MSWTGFNGQRGGRGGGPPMNPSTRGNIRHGEENDQDLPAGWGNQIWTISSLTNFLRVYYPVQDRNPNHDYGMEIDEAVRITMLLVSSNLSVPATCQRYLRLMCRIGEFRDQ
jgi:hypothetical protein